MRASWDLAPGSANASLASPAELPSLPQAVPTRTCFCGPDHEPDHLVSLMAAAFLSTCSLEGKLPKSRIRTQHLLIGAQTACAHTSYLCRLPPCGPGAKWTKNHRPRQMLKNWLPLKSQPFPHQPQWALGVGQWRQPDPAFPLVCVLGEPESVLGWGEI